MYTIMNGNWKEDTYAIHRTGNPSENSLVTCGLTMEQAVAIKDELNALLNKGNNISSEIVYNNPAKELAIELTDFFRKTGQMK